MNQNSVRLDKWLWAARFFRTRALAASAVTGGMVHVNGKRTKPGRTLSVGDKLDVTKGPYTFEIVVRDLSVKRAQAKVAQTLYEESEESWRNRLALTEQLKHDCLFVSRPDRRPDKRDRRRRIKAKGKA
jgi:ribosome-associated heat shock protein Hsp15